MNNGNEEELIEIADEGIPMAFDISDITGYLALLLISMIGAGVILIRRRRA